MGAPQALLILLALALASLYLAFTAPRVPQGLQNALLARSSAQGLGLLLAPLARIAQEEGHLLHLAVCPITVRRGLAQSPLAYGL